MFTGRLLIDAVDGDLVAGAYIPFAGRDVSVVQVYRRVLPFVAADFIRLTALTYFRAFTLAAAHAMY